MAQNVAANTRGQELSGPEVDAPDSKRFRVQLDFSPSAYDRLQKIRELSDAKTNAEAVRNALRLYEWLLEQARGGFKVQATDGRTVRELVLV